MSCLLHIFLLKGKDAERLFGLSWAIIVYKTSALALWEDKGLRGRGDFFVFFDFAYGVLLRPLFPRNGVCDTPKKNLPRCG